MPDGDLLSIGELATRTGVGESTLRAREGRHAFPTSTRSSAEHRRYREADVQLVQRVVSERAAGVSLAAAITRVRRAGDLLPPSVYAALRRQRPEMEPRTLRQPLLLTLTRAIEDESLSRASTPLLFASFQRETAYRRSEARWRELSHGARCSMVFADFTQTRSPGHGPIEVRVPRGHPLGREWTVVCCASDHAACLSAWEPPGGDGVPGRDRVYETVWSVDTEVVWQAARICAGIARHSSAPMARAVSEQLERDAEPPAADQLELATAITVRLLSYLT